ncbi:MAG: Uncharacterised protein [Opitutia bacterium UBA7350]|nr:MAG: Uncharacterised protein [Opitutae bacterium UBA7350]
MKRLAHNRTLLLLLSLILLPLHHALAQDPPNKAQPQNQQSRLLMQLLKMDSAEITELRRTLERIESMNPEEKKAFAESVQRLHTLPSETAKRLHQDFLSIPPDRRKAMYERWRALSPEQRKAWRQRMHAIDPAQRLEQIKKEGVLPWHRYGNQRESKKPITQIAKPITLAPAPQTQDNPDPQGEN